MNHAEVGVLKQANQVAPYKAAIESAVKCKVVVIPMLFLGLITGKASFLSINLYVSDSDEFLIMLFLACVCVVS